MKLIRSFSAKVLSMVLATALLISLSSGINASAVDVRSSYGFKSYKDGKYYAQQTKAGDVVFDKSGNIVISPGRYMRADYLGSDLFVVNKITDGNNANNYYYKELSNPYLYNAKKKTETKIELKFEGGRTGMDVLIHPYSEGYARVENGAFYAWTTMTYYQFIDKSGKSIGIEKPYSWCSDIVKIKKELFYFTKGDELSYSSGMDKDSLRRITKRNIKGEKVKETVLTSGKAYSIDLVKSGKKYYLRVLEGSELNNTLNYFLLDQNLKKVKASKFTQDEIKTMKSYDSVETVRGSYSKIPYPAEANGSLVPGRDWCFISPATTKDTCFDVTSVSTEENAWVMLYTRMAKEEKYAGYSTYELDGPNINQAFIFEPVGTDDLGNTLCRIWAAHSGRQLKSYYNKEYNITVLAQGLMNDKDSKGNEIKAQIFTLITNPDNTISIVDYEGRYLTMSYGETKSGTTLVFADYAGGADKQKYRITGFSLDLKRDGQKRY